MWWHAGEVRRDGAARFDSPETVTLLSVDCILDFGQGIKIT